MKIKKNILLIIILLFFSPFTYSQKAEKFGKVSGYHSGCDDILTDAAGSHIMVRWEKITTTLVSYDYYIQKWDSVGNYVTSFPAGGTFDGELWTFAPVKVKTDAQNNVYISFIDDGFLGGGAIPKLRKYDPNGVFVWEVQTSSAATDIAIDDSLNVYITSDRSYFIFTGASATVITPPATQKISSSGNILWTDTIHYAEKIVAVNEKIVLTMSPTTCLSANDSLLWTSPTSGNNISVFHDKIYVSYGGAFACLNDSGVFQWSIPFNGLSMHTTNISGYSALIKSSLLMVVDSSGNLVWQNSNVRSLNDVAIENNGNVYVKGGNNNCYDWFMCPIYVPTFPMTSGSTCTDPWAYYQYYAEYSYDPLNNNFIYVHLINSNPSVFYCPGDNLNKSYDCFFADSYSLVYQTCGQFGIGNQFIQLIDDTISFTSPDTIYNNTIPLNTPAGVNYYKVMSTNPVLESNIYALTIRANPVPVITSSDISNFCPGDTVILTVSYPNPNCGYFDWYKNNILIDGPALSTTVFESGIYSGSFEVDGEGCDIKHAPLPIKIRANFGCFSNYHHIKVVDGNRNENITRAINLYPNPFTDKATIFHDGNSTIEIDIYSTDGRLIKTIFCNNCNTVSFGEELVSGIYYLHYKTTYDGGILPLVKL